MLKLIKRLTCRHSYMWSERRKLEVCYHCGGVRLASDFEPASPMLAGTRPINPAILPDNDAA